MTPGLLPTKHPSPPDPSPRPTPDQAPISTCVILVPHYPWPTPNQAPIFTCVILVFFALIEGTPPCADDPYPYPSGVPLSLDQPRPPP